MSASTPLETARQQCPSIAQLLPDPQLQALLQVSSPDQLNKEGLCTYVGDFDLVQFDQQDHRIQAVQSFTTSTSRGGWHTSNDLYLRTPSTERPPDTQGELLTLCSPVPTRDVPVFTWLQQLLATLTLTLKQLFWTASSSALSVPELLESYPLCIVVLVSQVRFTCLTEQALAARNDLTLQSVSDQLSTIVGGLIQLSLDSQEHKRTVELLMPTVVGHANSAQWLAAMPLEEVPEAWRRHLRYYISDDANLPAAACAAAASRRRAMTCSSVLVQCGQFECEFGFNYSRKYQHSKTLLTYQTYYTVLNDTAVAHQRAVVVKGNPGTAKAEVHHDLGVDLGFKSRIARSLGWWLKRVDRIAAADPQLWLVLEDVNRFPKHVVESLIERSAAWARPVLTAFTVSGRDPDAARSMYYGDDTHMKHMSVPESLSYPAGVPVIEMQTPDFCPIVEVYLASCGFSGYKQIAHRTLQLINWCRTNLATAGSLYIQNSFYEYVHHPLCLPL